MKTAIMLVLAILMALSAMAATAPGSLSDEAVSMALNGEGQNHYAYITDWTFSPYTRNIGNRMGSIFLVMPESLLANHAHMAKKTFNEYTPSDEDRRASLTILAQGDVGKTINEGCLSITRVVLISDPSGGVVREAYLSEPMDETWRNAFGATNNCQYLRAKFSLADVQAVQAAAPNNEFFVAVFSGDVKTKTYKIKTKYQAKLQLEMGMSREAVTVRAPDAQPTEAQAVPVMPAPPVVAPPVVVRHHPATVAVPVAQPAPTTVAMQPAQAPAKRTDERPADTQVVMLPR